MTETNKNIVISGLTAAGKTTHSLIFGKDFGLNNVEASKILLENARMKPKSRDFWLSENIDKAITKTNFDELDKKLIQIQSSSSHNIFDCLSLPWLSSDPSLYIWLESSIQSRTFKAMVSYHGESKLTPRQIELGIKQKDDRTREFFQIHHNFDLYTDRKPFSLILDISNFITSASDEASQHSIMCVDEIMRPVVDWYLNETNTSKQKFLEQYEKYGSSVIKRFPHQMLS